jgi:hypothetical protein
LRKETGKRVGRAWMAGLGMMAVVAMCVLPAMAAGRDGDTVPQCSRAIQFKANYLAEAKPGQGPGFLFEIENRTAQPITLADPVPSSAHWYAHVGNLWLWRASAGRGGALVNAINVHGPVFVFRAKQEKGQDPKMITIPAHGRLEWTEWMRDDPAIAYDPSCAQCTYKDERNFRAVFAYAWLPAPGQRVAHLLTCGLRSNPVDMPPLELPAKETAARK